MHSVREISVAARTSLSSTYDSVAELARFGLVSRVHGCVNVGPTTLDDVAEQYRLDEERAQRIAAYRVDRQAWRAWLGGRRDPGPDRPVASPPSTPIVQVLSADDELAYQMSVMATGPPELEYSISLGLERTVARGRRTSPGITVCSA